MSFRLASLLRVRHLQQAAAASVAAAAAAEAGAGRRAVLERRDELVLSGFVQHGDEKTFAATVAARSASSSRYVESMALAADLDTAADAARDGWTAARRTTLPLERLSERHAAEEAAQALRADQATLDEHGLRAHSAQTRSTPDTAPEPQP